MKAAAPQFRLARVYDDGSREVELVSVGELPLGLVTSRRGVLGAGLTAAGVLGAVGCAPVPPAPSAAAPAGAGPRPPSPARAARPPPAALPNCNSAVAYSDGVGSLAISADGKTLATGSGGGPIKLWSLPGAALLRVFPRESQPAHSLAISPDGRTLFSGGHLDGSIRLWSLAEGRLLHSWRGHKGLFSALAVSPDGQLLASASGEAVHLWSVERGESLRELVGHKHRVRSLAISRDSKTLASGDEGGALMLWSLPDGESISVVGEHSDRVRALIFLPDGRTLASADEDGSIRIRDLHAPSPARTWRHGAAVNALAASADGRALAAGGPRSIKVWNPADGGLLRSIALPDQTIRGLALAADGTLVGAAAEGAITLWDLTGERPQSCLIDLSQSSERAKGTTYRLRNEYGQLVTYTLPCGSPIPAGAVCTCNCVPGSIALPKPAPAPAPSRPSTGGGRICTCVPVCVCMAVPVCQAHRLLDNDGTVRTLARQSLLLMGAREFDYMHWAAATAPPALARTIETTIDAIARGAQASPRLWPGLDQCLRCLDSADEVVAIMGAQFALLRQRVLGEAVPCAAMPRIVAQLATAARRPWYLRHAVGHGRRGLLGRAGLVQGF